MNIQEIVNDLKQIAAECEKVTSGNVSHKIANIEHGILNIADYLENYCPLGWHSAIELPPLDNDGNSQDMIVICGTMNLHFDLPRWSAVVGGTWGDKDVKWWCYPPKDN